jgi:superfamily II DNA helicase RecQ
MQVRVFTLGFDPVSERFDDTAVRDFLADKVAEGISDHFFLHDGRPYLTLVVRYRRVAPAASAQTSAKSSGSAAARDAAWRDLLSQEDWPLFNRLREWRGERAKAEGIPPYVICNNRQLAEIVQRKPGNLSALAETDGFGEAKLKKYGRELLAIIQGAGAEEGDDAAG